MPWPKVEGLLSYASKDHTLSGGERAMTKLVWRKVKNKYFAPLSGKRMGHV
jgi:hypothetical protein